MIQDTILTRRDDELHLKWVRLRTRGYTSVQIAQRYGVRPERVRTVTNRIFNADSRQSGENIKASYWRAA